MEDQTLIEPTGKQYPYPHRSTKVTQSAAWTTSVLFGAVAAVCVLITNTIILVWAKLSLRDIEDGVVRAFDGT